ncbi:multifunctional: acetaldehyde-CoA dehydrogenase (N-terminal); iron-dependent alcohol dehydrogenase (C-terminal); pyruvate-formate lyase deactivase (fragment) [Xenorhabdus nematophila ATCC 19061]|uniref:Multifunctional: acetaldehyde-CoA dehydrogenase (N-terminal) iron-dependent alcohol dehydrogenase (C-terminal) pyruvate-formate lyase deactivase n=1 Tax=Xenorhabdus nematophila (strain ATCC 19061 / DSM 3370 / CCUG 14189 / LMG 1036 / NCIMB 9965 / AN6) TaxID=406817 RepID=D3VH96_XENNA
MVWLEEIKSQLDIPASIRETGVQESDFLAKIDKLAEDAFDDQCTGANPRYPLISELKQLLLDSFYGRKFTEQTYLRKQ